MLLIDFDFACDAFMMFLLDMWTLFMIELILMICLVVAYDYVEFVGMEVGC